MLSGAVSKLAVAAGSSASQRVAASGTASTLRSVAARSLASQRELCHSGDDDFNFVAPVKTMRKGLAIVHDPISNKGTAFPQAERDRLRIRGLVPPRQLSIETQSRKIMETMYSREHPTDLERHTYLAGLQDRNETLFYRVLVDNIEKVAPIIYTPTVGEVCKTFAGQYRRSRGMYLSTEDVGNMGAIMHHWPYDDVQVVVITDGSRILGLGDLGVNGMGIPIGKLALYVAAGGIDPRKVLPVMLDAGTNNQELLDDPYYLGMQHPRLTGDAYYRMVHEALESIYARWPQAMVQFEDFASGHAQKLLDRYRHQRLCFNDDIQGTGATTLAALLCSLRHVDAEVQPSELKDQRIVVVGAGSAGLGVAQAVMSGMVQQGLTPEEAAERFYVLDADGLLGDDRDLSDIPETAHPFVRKDMPSAPLLETVQKVKPTMLLGLTGVPGVFTEEVIRTMAEHVKTPIVFPLSNPTSRAECSAEQVYKWTDGRAVFASGSPFDPVQLEDGSVRTPSQANNVQIFPGVGLGATICAARHISDSMFYAAATELAQCVPEEDIAAGMVMPRIRDIRTTSQRVASAVMRCAMDEGIARHTVKVGDLQSYVAKHMWEPQYHPMYNPTYR